MKVLFAVLDTLRADHLGCYGYKRNTSPNLDKLAENGVLFLNAYPSDVPTQPSYTAMFTGRRGIFTGVVSHSESETLSAGEVFFPEILEREGYETAAVSTLYHMKKYFARGFKTYMNPVAGSVHLTQAVTADQINDMALPWLERNKDRDFFLFLHYWDPHTPYNPPQQYKRLFYKGNEKDPKNKSLEGIKDFMVYPFTQRLLDAMGEGITDIEYVIAQYDAEIRYVDEKFGEVIEALEAFGILEDTLIIVTSDHGENLGENGVYFDHATVHEPTIHVPLILHHPSFPRGKRVGAFVQLIDIAPTIFEFLNLPQPSSFQGKSLLGLIKGERDSQYTRIYTNQGLWQAVRMIREGEWKLIKYIDRNFWPGPMLELFNLKDDPDETRNLVDEEPQIRDELELKLRKWEDECLGVRPDPLRLIAHKGLPPKQWVWRLIEENKGDYVEWRRKMGW